MIKPSAQLPTLLAAAADGCTDQAGSLAGRLQTRARSTSTKPTWSTSSPRSRRRITETHSSSRLIAQRLGHPRVARDVPVDRLARTERRPKPTGEHLGERGDGLSLSPGGTAARGH